MRPRRLFAVVLAFAFLTTQQVDATVMVRLSAFELAARSDIVVLATVRSVRSRIVIEQDAARPYTFVELAVERVQKGDVAVGEVLVLQETGGAWVERTQAQTGGNPTYRAGERVFVFAQRAPHISSGRYRTTAMAQGKFVVRSGNNGEVVTRDLRGLSFAKPTALGGISLRDGVLEAPRPLQDLLREMEQQ